MAGTGKTVVIIGANRGIGLGLVGAFRKRNYTVWGSIRPRSMNDDSAEELRKSGASVLEVDYLQENSILDAVEKLGDATVDILINNGGVGVNPRESMDETSDSLVEKFRIMTVGPFLATKHFMPLLLKSKLGKIINISSDQASITDMRKAEKGGRLGYRMSKSALNQMTVSMATEYRNGGFPIVFAAIHPGRVRTRLTGFNGSIDVEESVDSMVKVIEGLTLEQSGDFFLYTGEKLAY